MSILFKNIRLGSKIFTKSLSVSKPTQRIISSPVNLNLAKVHLKSSLLSRNYSSNSSNVQNYLSKFLPKSSPATSVISLCREIHDAPKKRPGNLRRKKTEHYDQLTKSGYFPVTAYATAEE